MAEAHKDGLTEDTKLIITIVLFFLVPWVGLIFMWVWMKNWPTWLKWVITAVVIIVPFVIAFMIVAGVLAAIIFSNQQPQYNPYQDQYPQQMMWEMEDGQQMTPEDLQNMTPEQLQQMMMQQSQNQDMMYQYGTPAAEPDMMMQGQ